MLHVQRETPRRLDALETGFWFKSELWKYACLLLPVQHCTHYTLHIITLLGRVNLDFFHHAMSD